MPGSPAPQEEDPWLTLAEIAEELRMSPATIRSWVANGTLQATRAGRRKWLVRRSELDRMLRGDDLAQPVQRGQGRPTRQRPRETVSPPSSPTWGAEAGTVDPEDWFGVAQFGWDSARSMSENAPPDRWFPQRLQLLSEAAVRMAEAIGLVEEQYVMNSEQVVHPFALSHELRPGGNRPGPQALWAEFDRHVETLAASIETSAAGAQRRALEEISVVLNDIADALPAYRGHYGEWVSRPEDSDSEEDDDGPSATARGVS